VKQYSNKEQLCFDDILLIPQHSDIESRQQVSLRTVIGQGKIAYGMSIPLIAAPMDTVCEWEMALKLRQLGGLGIIHRYNTIEQQAFQARMVKSYQSAAGFAIGATGDYIERAWALTEAGATLLLIDTANGHNLNAINAVKALRRSLGNNIHIMAGNVSTWEAFSRLASAGVDSVRVGIGGGSMCTTRIVTGHGMPTLASIMDIVDNRNMYFPGVSIIADGGIKNSGDAAKALAAGADAVMVGSLLAGTDEAPGKIKLDQDGGFYKEFRGMASREAQSEGRGSVSVVEGVATRIPHKGSVESVVAEFTGGLRSALSYSGARTIREFQENAEFIKVTHSSLGESKPHGKN
jgi:IMP dehydrogenase